MSGVHSAPESKMMPAVQAGLVTGIGSGIVMTGMFAAMGDAPKRIAKTTLPLALATGFAGMIGNSASQQHDGSHGWGTGIGAVTGVYLGMLAGQVPSVGATGRGMKAFMMGAGALTGAAAGYTGAILNPIVD